MFGYDSYDRICQQCGDPFLGRRDAKYCSSVCRQRAYNIRRRAKRVTDSQAKCNHRNQAKRNKSGGDA